MMELMHFIVSVPAVAPLGDIEDYIEKHGGTIYCRGGPYARTKRRSLYVSGITRDVLKGVERGDSIDSYVSVIGNSQDPTVTLD
jgi:hypothetical protein